MANSMLKKRRPTGRLFFNMEFPITIKIRQHLYIESGPSLDIRIVAYLNGEHHYKDGGKVILSWNPHQ